MISVPGEPDPDLTIPAATPQVFRSFLAVVPDPRPGTQRPRGHASASLRLPRPPRAPAAQVTPLLGRP